MEIKVESPDKFVFLPGNRPIDKRKVKMLQASVTNYGVFRAIVCFKLPSNQLTILDGQHLFEALRLLGFKEIPYVLISYKCNALKEKDNIFTNLQKFVGFVNNTQTKWSLQNYLEIYKKNTHYGFLLKEYNRLTSLSLSSLIYIYGEENSTLAFKAGKFRVYNQTKNKAIAECLASLKYAKFAGLRKFEDCVIQMLRTGTDQDKLKAAVFRLNSTNTRVPTRVNEIRELLTSMT